MHLDKSQSERRYEKLYKVEPQGIGATRSMLMKLLRTQDLIGWNTHEESGKLDKKAFTRFATGSHAVFARRTHVEAEASAVSILVDCSGSMCGNEIRLTQQVVVQLSKLLDKARVDFCINGFSDGDTRIDKGRIHTGNDVTSTMLVTEEPMFIPFKTWGESLNKASPKIGSMETWAGGGTPDYCSIQIAIVDISKRPEHKKILFIVTDANGYDIDAMEHLQKVADKYNVRIIAIGIGNTPVKQCFRHAEDVHSLEDLGDVAFKQLLKGVK